MTKCEKIAPLISEYVSGTLNTKDVWVVQSHIGTCEDCAKLAHEMQSLTESLRDIPVRQPSSNFDDSLAQRLAQLPKPSQKPAYSFRRLWNRFAPSPRRVARQSFAFAAAAAAIIGIFFAFTPQHSTVNDGFDTGLLANCMQQHRIDAAAQPLSDLSAQALSARPDAQDSKTDALSDLSDSENL